MNTLLGPSSDLCYLHGWSMEFKSGLDMDASSDEEQKPIRRYADTF
jgi:hypothetical protein